MLRKGKFFKLSIVHNTFYIFTISPIVHHWKIKWETVKKYSYKYFKLLKLREKTGI